jgi:hypothetical protein
MTKKGSMSSRVREDGRLREKGSSDLAIGVFLL